MAMRCTHAVDHRIRLDMDDTVLSINQTRTLDTAKHSLTAESELNSDSIERHDSKHEEAMMIIASRVRSQGDPTVPDVLSACQCLLDPFREELQSSSLSSKRLSHMMDT